MFDNQSAIHLPILFHSLPFFQLCSFLSFLSRTPSFLPSFYPILLIFYWGLFFCQEGDAFDWTIWGLVHFGTRSWTAFLNTRRRFAQTLAAGTKMVQFACDVCSFRIFSSYPIRICRISRHDRQLHHPQQQQLLVRLIAWHQLMRLASRYILFFFQKFSWRNCLNDHNGASGSSYWNELKCVCPL